METRVLESDVRPWGAWQVIDVGSGWKVKRLEIHPGRRLSYQTHARRSEHWAVVAGTATCVLDGATMVLRVGDSVDVPVGTELCGEKVRLQVRRSVAAQRQVEVSRTVVRVR